MSRPKCNGNPVTKKCLRSLVITMLSLILAQPWGLMRSVRAVAGDLDPTFGVNGIVTKNLAQDSQDVVNDIAVQADGRIVAVGDTKHIIPIFGPSSGAVVRFNRDGSVDTRFARGGIFILGSADPEHQPIHFQSV